MAAQERIEQFTAIMKKVEAWTGEDAVEPLLTGYPLSLHVTYYDGPGAVLFDRDGKPASPDLFRDEEQAVWVLRTLNALAEKAGLLPPDHGAAMEDGDA